MRFAQVLATGRYVPAKMVTNAELEARLGEPVHDWLVQNVGIERRHVMADGEVGSDMAVAAAREALGRAGLKAKDLDLIIVATDTPDYLTPGTASVVQHKLGADSAGTFDVNCACAGWVTALDVASKYLIADSSYRHVLVVGVYGMTRFVDWDDKKTCTLFADGAGAVVLGAGDTPGFMGARLLANGGYYDALGIYTGGTARPATPEAVQAHGKPTVQFLRRLPASFNTEHWPVLLKTLLERARLTLDDVDHFVFTQLNLRTIEATMAAMGQPLEKTHWTMDKWGYTGSACIPMTLDDAVAQGKVRRGDLVALCASGGGLAMASALVRWTA
ncbi:MAG: ketoacyl-ACP synthase III [Myxococcaceae bacterium]|nr:ketoacyl-ACP synthase III [Myxococcaceae bacterium]MCI0669564.1 ketoacyl-ACP synthase III [Myxococcaceae bacterium]